MCVFVNMQNDTDEKESFIVCVYRFRVFSSGRKSIKWSWEYSRLTHFRTRSFHYLAMLFFVFVTCVIHFRHQNKARKISLCGFCFHFNDCYLRPMAIQWNDLKNIISLKIPPWNDILFHFFIIFSNNSTKNTFYYLNKQKQTQRNDSEWVSCKKGHFSLYI